MWKTKILTLVLFLFLHTQAEGKPVNSGSDLYGISPDSKLIYIPPAVGPTTSLAKPDGQDPLKPTSYLVQKDESLVSVATRTKNNPQVLASLNKMPIDAKLRPGQSLILPSESNRSSNFQD